MNPRRLDRRVRKEATALLREAKVALLVKKDLKGKGGNLGDVASAMEKALASGDLAEVRTQLPILDALIDELVQRKPRSSVTSGVESLIVTLAIALSLKAFVIEAFKIPSSSMYPTLEIGDHIFVNKFIYGIRIPWTKTKIVTFASPKRGEVVVFMQPCEPDRDYIKRIVAVAGDTVEVRCTVLYVNGTPVPQELMPGTCGYDDNQSGPWEHRVCSRYRETLPDGTHYDTYQSALRPQQPLTPDPQKDFPHLTGDPPVTCVSDGKPPAPNQLAGTLVETNPAGGECEPQLHYVVPPGHVFAMGDNRANSNDSRFWGPVPIENIKGKAMFIWLSYPEDFFSPGSYRWTRIGNFVE